MKKIMLGMVFFFLASTICPAQNGLENITVEKYYVSNAADAAGSVGTLPVGSVTWRVYADMLPGYNLQALYGVAGHTLLFTTSTSFFNNEDFGSTTPTGISVAHSRNNSVMVDSWFSMGGNANGKVAILKTEDTDGSIGNANGILQNNDPSAGDPINFGLTPKDGMIAGTAPSVTFVGITNTGNGDLGVFDGTSQVGDNFTTSNGSIAVLGGVVGPTAANRVLIGQFTTDGTFCFELNVQIGTPSGGTQNFVASNPVGSEISIPSLTGCFGAPNTPPTAGITSPVNGAGFITGSVVSIADTSHDFDGNVDSVAFFVDGVRIGVDATTPFTKNWTAVSGAHCITAIAYDNSGASTTSAQVCVNVASNPPPTLNITAPTNGATVKRNVLLNITATATDNTGVDSVTFYYDGALLFKDTSSPYATSYTPTATGSHTILARAVDTQGAASTASVIVNVVNNLPPVVSITSPANGALFTFPASVAINANAFDADGVIDSVAFYVNGVRIGADLVSPYSFNWSSVIGAACITAKAYDDNGAVTTSASVCINIADPNALPYAVKSVNSPCSQSSFCLPVAANDTVADIIGYDLVLQYDKSKVVPTGVITMDNDLINPAYVDVINSIDAVNGLITISAFFNAAAPANANFSGIGNLLCVEFNKTANFNTVDTASFAIVSLQESYFNGVVSSLADAGKFITYRDSIFNGSLKFWIDDSPIKYNAANPAQYLVTNIYGTDASCGNQSLSAVQPDTLGKFQYVISNGVNVSIQKDIAGNTDVMPVINGADALLARKVLLNDLSFIPNVYQTIAMDVNLDGAISAGDVSQINQRTVLMIPEFKQAWNYNAQGQSNGQPSKDWLFIDSVTLATNPAYVISATYPLSDGVGFSKARVPVVSFCLPITATTADCPVITPETFKGVLIGDVNGNYPTTSPNGLFRQASDKIVFDLSKAVTANGYIDIPVSILSGDIVNSLDFAIKYNDANLAFNSIIDHTNYLQALSNFNIEDKTLRFTSNSLQNYDANKALVSVRFATRGAQITEADFTSLAGYFNGEQVSVEVVLRIAADNNSNDVLVNVYPNPASELLNITVSENATVELLDIEGRNVIVKTNVNANQKQEINTQSIANGVYMMKICNDNFVSMKKVVIKK